MIIFFLLYTFLFAQPAQADIAFPTTTKVQFQNNGQAVTSPVDFTVTCYGYSYAPGFDPEYAPDSYIESKVYSFSDTCATSDCTIDEQYYLNYRHIDFCSVTGTTDGKDFTISNIGDKPFGSCKFSKNRNRTCQSTFNLTNAINTNHTVSTESSIVTVIMQFVQPFWLALILTIVIETIMLFVCVKVLFRKTGEGLVWYNVITIGAILSSTTLPYVWFVIPNLLLGETFAVLFEAVLLKKFTKLSWFVVIATSLICNVTSYFVGLALMGWR